MYIKSLKYLLIFFLSLTSLKNYAQSKILIGYVYSHHDSLPMSRVNVYNVNQKVGAISSEKGRFFLNYAPGDSLQVSSVGYKTLFIKDIDSSYQVTFYMRIATFILDEVTIQNRNKYQDFQFKKNEKDFSDWAKRLNLPNSGYKAPPEKTFDRVLEGMSSPLSALYSAFSKVEKEKRAYHALLQDDYFAAFVSTIYNKEAVKNATPLIDDEEIERFMDFCKLSDGFVLNASQYDLLSAISNCYKAYKK
jgi:hypothetical protein